MDAEHAVFLIELHHVAMVRISHVVQPQHHVHVTHIHARQQLIKNVGRAEHDVRESKGDDVVSDEGVGPIERVGWPEGLANHHVRQFHAGRFTLAEVGRDVPLAVTQDDDALADTAGHHAVE